ncbi:multiheme c-type cytochrome [Deltaproteobacteria bacterium TL4]
MRLSFSLMFRILPVVITLFITNSAVAASANSLYFFATGDLRGEIKPCGCSAEGDKGGLLRRATYLDQKREQLLSFIYADLGNNFPPPSEQGSLKVKLIQKALSQLKPEVIVLGPNELLYGIPSLSQELPYMLSNTQSDWHVLPYKIIEITKKRVGIWGFLSPTMVYQNKNEKQTILPLSPQLFETWKLQFLKEKPDYKVLLFRGTENELSQIAEAQLFTSIITGNNKDDEVHQVLAMKASGKLFQSVPTKGQGVIEGDLSMNLAEWNYTWFTSKFSEHPVLKNDFKIYDDEVKELFFKNLDKMDLQQQVTPYVGVAGCKDCHLKAYEVWQTSKHAQAFETLEKIGKHYDPECIECHVVGFNNKGYLSPDLTPNFINVQCENCHGPSKQHAAVTTVHTASTIVVPQLCANCHKGNHSPLFDFLLYWPKILHTK